MGSGSSKQLKCPNDFNEEKFKTILLLYDKLDSNGDHVVQTDELHQIADLHVRNKIGQMYQFIDRIELEHEQKLSALEKEAELKIAAIKTQLVIDTNKFKKNKVEDVKDAHTRIDTLQNMTKEKKAQKFKDAISDKDGHINFWTFFHYMKDRTNDIRNIIW